MVSVLPVVVYVPSSVLEPPPRLSAQVQSPAAFELHDRDTPASAALVDVTSWAQVTPKLVRQLAEYVKSTVPDILVVALYVPLLVKVTVPLGWMWLERVSRAGEPRPYRGSRQRSKTPPRER